jgi:membrane-associated progesterone receptor component
MVSDDKIKATAADIPDDEPDPPRNFTKKQLAHFDGTKEGPKPTDEDKPVYLAVQGIVFDVTLGRDFYGPDGPYEKFAGHECGVALAKMSFDEEHLDNLDGCANLNFGERTELEGWIDKFSHYRCYPIMGKLVPDSKLDPTKVWTTAELAKYNGEVESEIPEGYGAAPIYIGAGENVYDVSFGGAGFYGPGGPYHKFAGKNASRALGKMSLDVADLENTDVSDLTDKQKKILADWIKTFGERKGYPVVGRLVEAK